MGLNIYIRETQKNLCKTEDERGPSVKNFDSVGRGGGGRGREIAKIGLKWVGRPPYGL